MSKVIEFLEKMGCEAQWRTASRAEIEQALEASDIEMPVREAILAKDMDQLDALLEDERRSHGIVGVTIPAAQELEAQQFTFNGTQTPSPTPIPTIPIIPRGGITHASSRQKTIFATNQTPSPTIPPTIPFIPRGGITQASSRQKTVFNTQQTPSPTIPPISPFIPRGGIAQA